MIAIQNGLAPSIPFKRSPNVGGRMVPEFIVLHDTASTAAAGSISWLCDPVSKVSAHVVIGRDGAITQLVPFNIKAWHAGQSIWQGRQFLNGFSIGIEIVNPGRLVKLGEGVYGGIPRKVQEGGKTVTKYVIFDTNKDRSLIIQQRKTAAHGDGYWLAYTPAQVAAVRDLCEAICRTYDIAEILTHWLISPGRKVDTNPLYPLEALRNELRPLMTTKPVGIADLQAGEYAVGETDESADGELAPIVPGNDYEAITGTRDTDESAGGVPAIWRLIKSRIAQASGGISISAILGLLTDWKVVAVLCTTGILVGCGVIIYRRSKVQ